MKVTQSDVDAIELAVGLFKSYQEGGNECKEFDESVNKINKLAMKIKRNFKVVRSVGNSI